MGCYFSAVVSFHVFLGERMGQAMFVFFRFGIGVVWGQLVCICLDSLWVLDVTHLLICSCV